MNRLQQIEAEIRELDAKREALIHERKNLLVSQQNHSPNHSTLKSSEKIELFLSLFRCRADVFPKLWEKRSSDLKGYSPACGNEWAKGFCEKPRVKCSECIYQKFPPLDETAVRDHLTGKHTIGTYAIRADNTCIFLAADFDGNGWQDDLRAYRQAALELGIRPAIERSRSGNGGHAWIFFSEAVPALMARRLGTIIVAKASSLHPTMALSTYDRFFPNQDFLPAGGFGNLIALPLQAKARELGNSVFLEDDFTPHLDQWHYLLGVQKIGKEDLGKFIECSLPQLEVNHSDQKSIPSYEDRALDLIPEAIHFGTFTDTAYATRFAQLEIPTSTLPKALVAGLKRLATLVNPVFFEKQRLRFGTYNIPRFIFCGEIHPDRLILPRGVSSAAVDLFKKAGGKLLIEDRRPLNHDHAFSFNGILTNTQQDAVTTILAHDDGILCAPPGAGKTVMGCAIIAKRSVSTLILVHRKPLLEQWRSRLIEFLGLKKNQIGVLSGEQIKPTVGIVLGMIQTLSKSISPEQLLEPFSQVIIDECHHVPAASFEAVMKACPASFILGLTATPTRKDGLQKILFLQCGPIRHRMKSEANPEISRKLIIRDIHLNIDPDKSRMPIHEVWGLLVNHDGRNIQIAIDIQTELSNERCCAVLSDRKEHLIIIENLLKTSNPEMIDRIYRVDGSMGKKQRASIFGAIDRLILEGKGFALLATSSLLGEGFDLPQLDTLFLTLPISFKGRLIQYAGRLHRSCAGKKEVRIYDYVEPEHPLTAHMHRKRLSAYRSMGYEIDSGDGFEFSPTNLQ